MFARIAGTLLALLILVQPLSAAPIPQAAVEGPGHPEQAIVLDDATASAPKAEPASPEEPNAPTATFDYLSVPGAGFMPSSSTINWFYPGPNGGGCVHPTVLGQWRATLSLRSGTKISSLWFGYYNYSGSLATTLRLYRYDQRGPELELGHVVAPGSSAAGSNNGYHQVSFDVSPDHVVDNSWYSYVFVWEGPADTAHVQELCSAQVGYYPLPVFGTFVPALRK